MPLVEMMGISGIGKSTLAADLLAGKVSRSWTLLDGLDIPHTCTREGLPEPYGHLLNVKERSLQDEGRDAATINSRMSIYVFRAWRDHLARSSHRHRLLLADENMLQHFSRHILALVAVDAAMAAPLLAGRNVILLCADGTSMVEMTERRNVPGAPVKAVTDAGKFQAELIDLVTALHTYGSTCLVLDAGEGLSSCATQARVFLDDVRLIGA